MGKYKPNKPFIPQLVFVLGVLSQQIESLSYLIFESQTCIKNLFIYFAQKALNVEKSWISLSKIFKFNKAWNVHKLLLAAPCLKDLEVKANSSLFLPLCLIGSFDNRIIKYILALAVLDNKLYHLRGRFINCGIGQLWRQQPTAPGCVSQTVESTVACEAGKPQPGFLSKWHVNVHQPHIHHLNLNCTVNYHAWLLRSHSLPEQL